MKKKWLVAVFASKKDKILKIWSGKVSCDVTDVTVPENTVFYFFSTCEEVNVELTHVRLSTEDTIAWMSDIKELVHEGKIYCEGIKKNNSIVLRDNDFEIEIDNFFNFAKIYNLKVEFV